MKKETKRGTEINSRTEEEVLLKSRDSRSRVPSAPCRGREHGRETVWIIIGQKSTRKKETLARVLAAARLTPHPSKLN